MRQALPERQDGGAIGSIKAGRFCLGCEVAVRAASAGKG